MIEREPITIVCSKMGWIRAMKGHVDLGQEMKFKDGDEARFAFHAETTDRILLFGSNGRFYTLGVDKLPGGRGHGEPLRLMIDLPQGHDVVAMLKLEGGRKFLVASDAGRGFVVPESYVDVIGTFKNVRHPIFGRQRGATFSRTILEHVKVLAHEGAPRACRCR